MRTLARYALSVGVAAALLASCGRSQPPIGAPVFRRRKGARSSRTPNAADHGCYRKPSTERCST